MKMIELLLEHNADTAIIVQGQNGAFTALSIAQKLDHLDVVALLKEHAIISMLKNIGADGR